MTKTGEQLEIKLSKTKITLLIIGALIFVAIGIWFMVSPPEMSRSGRRAFFGNPAFLFFIGTISVVFFGICLVFGVKKLFDNKPGMVINEKGIVDNSSGLSIGLIPWIDIEEIAVISVNNQKFIFLIVNQSAKLLR